MAIPQCPHCSSKQTRPEVLHPAFAVEIWSCRDCRASLEVLRGSRRVRTCIPYRATFQSHPAPNQTNQRRP